MQRILVKPFRTLRSAKFYSVARGLLCRFWMWIQKRKHNATYYGIKLASVLFYALFRTMLPSVVNPNGRLTTDRPPIKAEGISVRSGSFTVPVSCVAGATVELNSRAEVSTVGTLSELRCGCPAFTMTPAPIL